MAVAQAITVQVWGQQLAQTAAQMRASQASLMAKLRVTAVAQVRKRFDQSRAPDGTPWKPIKFRARGGNKPLRDTGLLMASITARTTGNTLIVGTNRVGAALHQFGGTITPKRAKFLAIPKTREAARHEPRRFPRPLAPVIGGRGGVLVDKRTGEVHYALTKGPVVIPARPFLGAGPADMAQFLRIIQDHYAIGGAA